MQCVCFILLGRRGYGRILIDVISIKAQALTVHKVLDSEWDTVIMNTWMREMDLRFLSPTERTVTWLNEWEKNVYLKKNNKKYDAHRT